MARKRLTKKANKTSAKVKRQAKITALTVAETLKQLPKQFKKELATLKKQTKKLTVALNKAKKQKNKAHIALTKKSTKGKILTAARKAYNQISQTMTHLTLQLDAANNSVAFLSQKQAALVALSKPIVIAKKPGKKLKKAKLIAKSQKKLLKSSTPVTSTYENIKTITSDEPTTAISTPEPEVEFNS